MSVSYLPRARVVVDLASTRGAIEPISCGVRGASAPPENWDSLLRLIMARLRLTVGERGPGPNASQEAASLQKVQSSVLECVSALGQLYGALVREEGRRDQLEQEIREARIALAKVCDELAGAKTAEKRLRYHSLHDEVTLLPNEEYFGARLARALLPGDQPRQAVAILYLRIEDFKTYLDQFGQSGADELLKIIAARLALAVRAEDMLSRRADDAFACLVTGHSNPDHLSDLAYKLLGVVSAPLQIGIRHHCVRANIGIAIHPEHGANADTLLAQAEFAMARAQAENTGYAFCDES
jgi:diguanylate cyclase (GGDEF)-like protein